MKREIDILSIEECRALMSACPSDTWAGIRNSALILVLWRSCLRISEALSLYPKDLTNASIRVQNGKGDRARTVGLDPEAHKVIYCWLIKRGDELKIASNRKSYLFCTRKGGPLGTSYCRHLLKRLGCKAGLEKRVHPHGLRHSGAVHYLEAGKDVVTISRILGHSNLATTNTYLNHLKPVDVIAAMQSCDVWKQKTDITAPQSPKDLSDSELGALIRSGKLTDIETVELLRNSMKPVSHFEEHDTETK
jgi:site-specific recombinase XerD|tara:strand:- start:139 stop:885 length:747 start_codon:yes stop_codon:yes gene_type:complete